MTKSFDEISAVLSEMSGVKLQNISFGTRLRYDLHLTDVQVMELIRWMEEKYGVDMTDDSREGLHRVSDLLAVVSRAS